MPYIENHASLNLALMCIEFFFGLAFDSVSYNRPSHVQSREKTELELLTGTVTKPVDHCKRKSSCTVSIFRLFKGVCFKGIRVPQMTTLRYHRCTFVHKIGSASLENGLESKMNIAPISSHLCPKKRVSEFFLIWPGRFVFCTRLNFEV